MEIVRTRWRRTAVATVALAVLAPLAAHALTLAPHRAVYELSRHRDSTDTQVVSVSGALEVTFEAACGGWRLEQHLGFRFYGPEGDMVEHLATFSAFEAAAGDELWFRTLSYYNRELDEEISGVARPRTSSAGEVHFSKPEEAVKALPAGTLLPMSHLRELLGAAAGRRRQLARLVFDGSTFEGPYEVSAFLGTERDGADWDALAGHRAWPVRLAYFKPGAVTPSPEFEMGMLLHDNGVAGDMVYDYGELVIGVKLLELEMLVAPQCAEP